MIYFKDGVSARGFTKVDIRLKRIVWCMEAMAKWMSLDELVITSIHRNDRSTHGQPPPYRFVDVAVLVNGGMGGSERLRRAINDLFPYGGKPGLQTIPELRHASTVSGKVMPAHFHLQVKPR